jgi:hypothetical protein
MEVRHFKVHSGWWQWHVRHDAQQIKVVIAFLIMFGTPLNILFTINVKTIVLMKRSYKLPPPPFQLCWPLNLERLSYVEHATSSLINTCLCGIYAWSHTQSHRPPKYKYMISNQPNEGFPPYMHLLHLQYILIVNRIINVSNIGVANNWLTSNWPWKYVLDPSLPATLRWHTTIV